MLLGLSFQQFPELSWHPETVSLHGLPSAPGGWFVGQVRVRESLFGFCCQFFDEFLIQGCSICCKLQRSGLVIETDDTLSWRVSFGVSTSHTFFNCALGKRCTDLILGDPKNQRMSVNNNPHTTHSTQGPGRSLTSSPHKTRRRAALKALQRQHPPPSIADLRLYAALRQYTKKESDGK